MNLHAHRLVRLVWIAMLALAMAAPLRARAQNPFVAPSDAMDTLSEMPVGGANAGTVNRARAVAAPPPAPGAPAPAAVPGAAPAPAPGQPPPIARPGLPPGAANSLGAAKAAVGNVIRLRSTKCVVGTRVFDPITREMLDDAQTFYSEEAFAKANYYDDGTHGDAIAGDGIYSLIDTANDFIGQGNQRLKERLIQAIYTSEQLSPLEFYGYHILTTERHDPVPRSRRWTLASNGGKRPGLRLDEVETGEPVKMEKFRDKEMERDRKVEEWALGFLNEYRKTKGDINSEFYRVHIPRPPVPPTVAPPASTGGANGWAPFPNPAGPGEADTPASAMSKYGYKVKQPLPNIEGGAAGAGGAAPYYDRKAFNKIYR